jgi:hypothetical protein
LSVIDSPTVPHLLFVINSFTVTDLFFVIKSLIVADLLFVLEDSREKRGKVEEGRGTKQNKLIESNPTVTEGRRRSKKLK